MMYNPMGIINTQEHLAKTWLITEYSLTSEVLNKQTNTVIGGCWRLEITREENEVRATAYLYEDVKQGRLVSVHSLNSKLSKENFSWDALIRDMFMLVFELEKNIYQGILNTLKAQGYHYAVN